MQPLFKTLLVLVIFAACKNQPAAPAAPSAPAANDASAILKHKYWVSKDFNTALFAESIVDTMSNLLCSELIFTNGDSLLLTACLSDAGRGNFKVTGPNTLEIAFEGFEGKPSTAQFDDKTGVLHMSAPPGVDTGWPTEFVAQDGIDVTNIDNVTINLGRKRLAGSYSILPKKGEVAIASFVELHPDGTQLGFGDFDTYEPWPSGIAGGFMENPQRNLMYFVKKGQESDPTAVAWQVHGDTLRIWDTKNTGADGDLPEYKIKAVRGTYLKRK